MRELIDLETTLAALTQQTRLEGWTRASGAVVAPGCCELSFGKASGPCRSAMPLLSACEAQREQSELRRKGLQIVYSATFWLPDASYLPSWHRSLCCSLY